MLNIGTIITLGDDDMKHAWCLATINNVQCIACFNETSPGVCTFDEQSLITYIPLSRVIKNVLNFQIKDIDKYIIKHISDDIVTYLTNLSNEKVITKYVNHCIE